MIDLTSTYLCLQCRTCSAACTAAPINGLRPREVVLRAAAGEPDLELGDEPWACVTCYACTEQCRAGIDITDLFYHLRNRAAARGRIPAAYRAVARTVLETGCAFPNARHTARMREALGLAPFSVPAPAVEEVKTLCREAGFPDLDGKEAS
ncbi:MAG: 4Fe-4S dicluster domain-containing protein [Planctomycetota bacterium]|jgi:heterodisulfide reductase subunit C